MKIPTITNSLLVITFILTTTLTGCAYKHAQQVNEQHTNIVFTENNGVIVIEAEDAQLPEGWLIKNSHNANQGQYIQWQGADYFKTPGVAVIPYFIDIKSPGHYQVHWANKIAAGNSPTDANDSWLKITSHQFYGKKEQHIVCPINHNNTLNACAGLPPEGDGDEGWFKVYRSGEKINYWSWSTNTSDYDHHDIWAEFRQPGIYQLFIAARSKGHAIDKIVLSKKELSKKELTTNQLDSLSEKSFKSQQVLSSLPAITLSANKHFLNRNIREYAPAYYDKARDALAIDATKYKDQFAAAESTFEGENGSYHLTLNTMTEIDGESRYQVMINDRIIGTFTNPESELDYQLIKKSWQHVSLKKGDIIRITFSSETNGKIPEGDITAYSRGRWQSVELTPAFYTLIK